MSFWKKQQQMGLAALIMGCSVLLSRFAGLIRDKVISYYFGATSESDIYFAAFVIPDFINYLLAGAYFSITLIPLLAEAFKENEEKGWHLFSAILTWITTVAVVLTGVAMICAPSLARLAAPGLGPRGWIRLTLFLRIVLPAQVCFLVGTCFTALLYLRKQFLVPAIAPLIYNLLIITGGILLKSRGMEGFCWGVLAGAFLGNLLLPYLAASRKGYLPLRITARDPDLKRFFRLALPLMLGQSIVVLDEQFIRVFGSFAGPGAISWLNYARRIMLVPVGVVAQAAGVASYPFLAELIARRDLRRFYETLGIALRNTLALMIPITIWMMVTAGPIITLVFQQGRFACSDTAHTTRLLIILLGSTCFWSCQQIIGRGFYALQDTLTPALLGTLTTIACIPFYYVGAHRMGAEGVALASAISITLYAMVLGLRWHQRHGYLTFKSLFSDSSAALIFSCLAAVPSLIICNFLRTLELSLYPRALLCITASGLVFAIGFISIGLVIRPGMLKPFLKPALALVRKKLSNLP